MALTRTTFRRGYGLTVAVLVVAHLFACLSGIRFGSAFYRLAHLDGEANVPAWFAVLGLITAAELLGLSSFIAYRARDRLAWFWGVLAVGFAVMSIDELASIHELLTRHFAVRVRGSGFEGAAWIIPMSGVVTVAGAFSLPFLRRLPRALAVRLVVAGLVYLSGAVCLDVVGAGYARANGYNSAGYSWLTAAEEACEFLGVGLLLDALLGHLGAVAPELVAWFRQGADT